VRQLGWLAATPTVEPKRGAKPGRSLSRLERIKQAKIEPPIPDNPMPFIIDRLMEIGPTETAGMGRAPISWQSIQAWRVETGVRMNPWQSRLLRRLSAAYLVEMQAAENPDRPAPFVTPDLNFARIEEEAQLRDVLG
jgi:hypothetical protein